MSNFYGTARTNLFRVKDEAAFKVWAETFGLEVYQWDSHPGMFGLLPNDLSDDGLFTLCSDEYGEEEEEENLAPGSVAVIMSAGAAGSRPGGWAEAVDHTGKRIEIHLYDIFEKAKTEFGAEPVRW